jgi:hypothetical protein
MGREDDIRDAINRAVAEFSKYDTNPITWQSWIVYLLESLQEKAMDTNPIHQEVYEDMLEMLLDQIRTRLRNGAW